MTETSGSAASASAVAATGESGGASAGTAKQHRPGWPIALLMFVVDAALVVAFIVAGRGQHELTGTIAGVWSSAWPFLAALTISWIVALVWRDPLAPLRSGVPVWLGTLIIGMFMRVTFTDGGAAFGFIAVATGVLAVFLVGPRLIIGVIRYARGRSTTR